MIANQLDLTPMLSAIAHQKDARRQKPLLLAIDGRAGSGKTTLANRLSQVLSCPVIHMDDFYLRPVQKKSARLKEAGGNTDYERFAKEVLDPLSKNASVRFRPYLCHENRFGAWQILPRSEYYIIEGSYSHHPYYGHPYDVTCFLDMDDAHQLHQLRQRESPETVARFLTRWIPLEDRYFEAFQIREKADFLACNHQWVRIAPMASS